MAFLNHIFYLELVVYCDLVFGFKNRIVIVLTLCCVYVSAHAWEVVSFNRISIYHPSLELKKIYKLESIFDDELKKIENRINYTTNETVDIFLTFNLSEAIHSNYLTTTGQVDLAKPKIVLDLKQSPDVLLSSYRYQITQILVDEMLYGQVVEDKIKYANVLKMPSWLMPGLYGYIANNWSDELDNTLRYIFEQKFNKNIKTISTKYHQALGASFWRFMEYKYGLKAIPNFLYMIRLTRKFKIAISYTCYDKPNNIIDDWLKYYGHAYQLDQNKSLPVDGIKLDHNRVIDVWAESDTNYISLEKSSRGFFVVENPTRIKIVRIPPEEIPIESFGQSFFEYKNQLCMILNSKQGVILYQDILNVKKRIVLPMKRVSFVAADDFHFYIVDANAIGSTIYRCSFSEFELLSQSDDFVSSMDIKEEKICKSVISFFNYQIHLDSAESSSVIWETAKPIHQILFADDTSILFNHGANGIINSKLLNIKSSDIHPLTNFRYNILHHSFDNDYFVEIINKVSHLEMFVVENRLVNEFYVYDFIPTSSLSEFKSSFMNQAIDESIFDMVDSLHVVSYQLPIYPVLSNYPFEKDQYPLAKYKQNSLNTPQLDFFEFSKIQCNITNQYDEANPIWLQNIGLLTPNNINLHVGSIFTNRLSEKEVRFDYTGLFQRGARDIHFAYYVRKKNQVGLNLLHRERSTVLNAKDHIFSTNQITINNTKMLKSNTLFWDRAILLRYDQVRELYTNKEGIGLAPKGNWVFSIQSNLRNMAYHKNNYTIQNLNINPNLNLISKGWNLSLSYLIKNNSNISQTLLLKSKLKATTSQGTSPTFYLLGGMINDILSATSFPSVSDFYTPMMYDNIFGIRGFNANYRNGNTALIINNQLEFYFMKLGFKNTIHSSWLTNLNIHLFMDVGTAFYGNGIFASQNMLGKSIVSSSTGSVITQVNSYRNPTLYSFGGGFGTNLIGYSINLDYAIGVDDQRINQGVIHIGIGKHF